MSEQERKSDEAEGCAAESALQMEEEACDCSIACILLRELRLDADSVRSGYDAGVVASSISSGTENRVSVHSSKPASVGHTVGCVFSGSVFDIVLNISIRIFISNFCKLLLDHFIRFNVLSFFEIM